MMNAIVIHRNGGPEVMSYERLPEPKLGPLDVLVRHTAIGVNFSDINVRRGGFYKTIRNGLDVRFPLILGNEAAGVVEKVGEAVSDFRIGDRVAYAGIYGQFFEDTGAYCELRAVPEDRLVPIPDTVTDEQAAAVLLKGSTASLIINKLYKPGPGDIVLVHTAAAGVGSLLCQWANHLGATVIGTVGSDAKASIASENGCHHVVLYRDCDFVDEVRKIAPDGIAAVYDGVGKDTFERSIGLLGMFGNAVNYGNASGSVPPIDIQALAMRSLSVARAGVTGHIRDTKGLRGVACALFGLVAQGVLRPRIDKTYALADAVQAHRDIENAGVSGSLLLAP
ncbi:quinone oxidoreductase [Pseudaminobacter sp. 19-2017]|uniref:Quinone oxidoreductase n=1 Tax=Pseudaminobacter soli (ex Zhang et al. 2022) TaxID=2831468 RepID=A0A942E2S1_9HYPH|nr:quinone oxidoreductase [Pseudaminobacter soli]MBS3652063.1 quinone oxidoreductase [Pseudaminobacter soli]